MGVPRGGCVPHPFPADTSTSDVNIRLSFFDWVKGGGWGHLAGGARAPSGQEPVLRILLSDFRFRVDGLGLMVQGSGFRVEGLGFGV